MTPPADTKDRILDVAETLLQERGFGGFSYADISAPLDIKNAAVHYHFPSKADLGTAVVRRFRERLDSYTRYLESKHGDDPLQLLDGYIAIPRSFLEKGALGCPVGVLHAEFSALPPPMQQETLLLETQMLDTLTRILDAGRERGAFRFEGPAKDKALLATAALQGALLMAHAGAHQAFATTVTQLKRDLGVH